MSNTVTPATIDPNDQQDVATPVDDAVKAASDDSATIDPVTTPPAQDGDAVPPQQKTMTYAFNNQNDTAAPQVEPVKQESNTYSQQYRI